MRWIDMDYHWVTAAPGQRKRATHMRHKQAFECYARLGRGGSDLLPVPGAVPEALEVGCEEVASCATIGSGMPLERPPHMGFPSRVIDLLLPRAPPWSF
jgi:hypothetical protein